MMNDTQRDISLLFRAECKKSVEAVRRVSEIFRCAVLSIWQLSTVRRPKEKQVIGQCIITEDQGNVDE